MATTEKHENEKARKRKSENGLRRGWNPTARRAAFAGRQRRESPFVAARLTPHRTPAILRPRPPEDALRVSTISFVIPLKDEEQTLDTLCAEIFEVVDRDGREAEVILVDDGSTDGSWQRIVALAGRDRRVRGLRLRRNVGKAAALSAGFAEVRGDIVFTLDADLQDDPHEIPRFLRRLDEGWDMVSGWKRNRHDPWHKVWPSRVFNRMIGALTGLRLHDHVCGFKCCRAEIVRQVDLYGEMHRFFAVRAFALGYRVTEIDVNHRPREHGRSKYGIERFIKGLLDLLTVWFTMRFDRRPMHFFGAIGILHLLAGGLVCGVSLVEAVMGPAVLGRAFWIGVIIKLLGLQWLGVGLVAESQLTRTAPRGPGYHVAERVGFDEVREKRS